MLHLQTAAARLLAKPPPGAAGPVLLTERRAASYRVTAAADLDPEAGGRDSPTRRPTSHSSRPRRARPCTSSGTPGSPT